MKKKFKEILEAKDVKKKKKAKGFYFGTSGILNQKIKLEEETKIDLRRAFHGESKI